MTRAQDTQVYITTPIYYVNGAPHVGHAHTSVMGDILKRCAAMTGRPALLTTGTDEHGQKNQGAIEQSGLSAEQYLGRQSGIFKVLFEQLDVQFDFFVRTTLPHHKAAVTRVLEILHGKGLIVRKQYSGLYCEGCEQFKRLVDLDERGCCKDHLVAPTETTEENYFLRMGVFQDWLVQHLAEQPDWIQPEMYRQEVLNMLAEPLEDLCISRPRSRVWLGIPLPFDETYVTYVWFDALINYVSSIGWPGDMERFGRWWPGSIHLMAKDIVKTHCIYWPIMLKALGLDPPRGCRVHGYWVGEGGLKMSKAVGNVVDPFEMIRTVGTDAFRFYMACSMGKGEAQISVRRLQEFYRGDLANNLGNLHLRVTKMARRYFDGRVPPCELQDNDRTFLQELADRAGKALPGPGDLTMVPAMAAEVLAMGRALNLYIDRNKPWSLAKDAAQAGRLAEVLYVCLDGLRLLMQLAWPIMPRSANEAVVSLALRPLEAAR